MATKEQIGALISAVAPVLDPLEVVAFPEENSWAIAMEDDLAVTCPRNFGHGIT